MNKYTFCSQNGKAYYCNSIPGFLKDNSGSIIEQLIQRSFEVNKDQADAWTNQISELQSRLQEYGLEGDIIFEYDIIRLGRRIDVILLISNMVFSLEFKNGEKPFTAHDAQQAEDYALDIKNFHKESEDLYVCPILVVTKAPKYSKVQSLDSYPDKQIHLQRENIQTLMPKISRILEQYGSDQEIDFEKWFNSPYHPTPTIVEAAVQAYSTHDISEIAHSEAGQNDIDLCEAQISEIVDYAKENHQKCICFVTGVPGAGKTLVGLDIAAKNMEKSENSLSIYLSGNGPLVKVLQEALKQSAKEKEMLNSKTKEAIKTLIQGSYAFKRANAASHSATPEHILIFDEAQRVWDAKKMKSKHDGDPLLSVSEPHILMEIMDRHQDWAVIICLVGLGQDIYDGEAGINEWFKCAIDEFPDWKIYYSPQIFEQTEDKTIDKEKILQSSQAVPKEHLQLNISVRTFRAKQQAEFVSAVLNNQPESARELYRGFQEEYPIFITRDIRKAKKWVRKQVRGSQRCGLLACSSAQRLKPEGIYVLKDIDVKNWFLAPSSDIRSSNMMEIAASEFKVQGLELDWAVVCWDQDLRRSESDGWEHYNFRGSKWTHRNQPEQIRYLENSYRVLLTRARQGMVLFVPEGVDVEEDSTRDSEVYDRIYDYLVSCGIPNLPE